MWPRESVEWRLPMARYHKTKKLWEASRRVPHVGRPSAWGATEAEADARLEQKLANLISPSSAADSLDGFAQTFYLPTVRHTSEKWREQIAWALDAHILKDLGSRPVAEITRHELQTYLNAKLRRLSRSSVGHLRKVLYAVLSLAEADDLIPKNPVRHVKLPPPEHIEPPTYDVEQCLALMQIGWATPVADFVFLAAFLGLRSTEAANAEWRRGERVLRVRSAKTAAGVREMPLPEVGIAYLESRGDRFKLGKSESRNMRERYLYPAMAGAGLPWLRPHELRHSFATNLRRLGCPEDVRADLLGHKGRSITRRYSHDWEDGKRQWLSVLMEPLRKMLEDQAA